MNLLKLFSQDCFFVAFNLHEKNKSLNEISSAPLYPMYKTVKGLGASSDLLAPKLIGTHDTKS